LTEIRSLSPRQLAFRRFVSHKAAVVSSVIIAFLILFVFFSPITARYGVNESVKLPPNSFLPPQGLAWLGTDDIGRDLYSRLIFGIRVSLIIGASSAIISVALGCLIGAVAGFRGGKFDDIVMRVTDLFLAFPFLVALLVVRNTIGAVGWLTPVIGDKSSIRFIVFLLAIFGWMGVARIVRGQILALKEREFIEAARAVGAASLHHHAPPIAQLGRANHGCPNVFGGWRDYCRGNSCFLWLRAASGGRRYLTRSFGGCR
jgi:peptide/nickel transport system permease protein